MPLEVFAYYRVSTNRQGVSGLGLDAQRAATKAYIENNDAILLGEFVEVESGKRTDRPELHKALAACRQRGATLLIAKLDRLARNVHFISGLLETNVRFVAIDMPHADRFMLHVYAAIAEEEARKISERTKSALAAAKARGVQLGANAKVLAAQYAKSADEFAATVGPTIDALRSREHLTYRAIAEKLNTDGISTFKGRQWHPTTVQRAHHRFQALSV